MIINAQLSQDTPEVEDYRRKVTAIINQNSTEFWTDEQWVGFLLHKLEEATDNAKPHPLSTFDIIALIQKADQIGLIVLNDWKPRSREYAELLQNYRSVSREFEAVMEQGYEDAKKLNAMTATVAEQQAELDFYEAESAISLICRGVTKLFGFGNGEGDSWSGPM